MLPEEERWGQNLLPIFTLYYCYLLHVHLVLWMHCCGFTRGSFSKYFKSKVPPAVFVLFSLGLCELPRVPTVFDADTYEGLHESFSMIQEWRLLSHDFPAGPYWWFLCLVVHKISFANTCSIYMESNLVQSTFLEGLMLKLQLNTHSLCLLKI